MSIENIDLDKSLTRGELVEPYKLIDVQIKIF